MIPNTIVGQHLWINKTITPIGNKGFFDVPQSSYGIGLWFNTNSKLKVGINHNFNYIFETKGFKKQCAPTSTPYFGDRFTPHTSYYDEVNISSTNIGASYEFLPKFSAYFMTGLLVKTTNQSNYLLIEKLSYGTNESPYYWILSNNNVYKHVYNNYIFGLSYCKNIISTGLNVELNTIQKPIVRFTLGINLNK